jgi:hypothetical protein
MAEQILDTPDVSVVEFSKKGVWLTVLIYAFIPLTQLYAGYILCSLRNFIGKEFFYLVLFMLVVSLFMFIMTFCNLYVLYIPMLRKMWKDDIALVLEDDGFLFYGEPRYIRTKILWADVVKLEIKKSIGTEYVYIEVKRKPYYDETLIWLHRTIRTRPLKTRNYIVALTNLAIDAHRLKQSIENRMGVKTDV